MHKFWWPATIATTADISYDQKTDKPVTALVQASTKRDQLGAFDASVTTCISTDLIAAIELAEQKEEGGTQGILIYRLKKNNKSHEATAVDGTSASLYSTVTTAVTSSAVEASTASPQEHDKPRGAISTHYVMRVLHQDVKNIIAIDDGRFASISSKEIKIWNLARPRDAYGMPLEIPCIATIEFENDNNCCAIYIEGYLIGIKRKEHRWISDEVYLWRLNLDTMEISQLFLGSEMWLGRNRTSASGVINIVSHDCVAVTLPHQVLIINYRGENLKLICADRSLFANETSDRLYGLWMLPDQKTWITIHAYDANSYPNVELKVIIRVWRAATEEIYPIKLRTFTIPLVHVVHSFDVIKNVVVRCDGCMLIQLELELELELVQSSANYDLWLLNPYSSDISFDRVMRNVRGFIPLGNDSCGYLVSREETRWKLSHHLVEFPLLKRALTKRAMELADLPARFQELDISFTTAKQQWILAALHPIVIEYTGSAMRFFPAHQSLTQLSFARTKEFQAPQRLPLNLAYTTTKMHYDLLQDIAEAPTFTAEGRALQYKCQVQFNALIKLANLLEDPNKSFADCVKAIRAKDYRDGVPPAPHSVFRKMFWAIDGSLHPYRIDQFSELLNQIEVATPRDIGATANTNTAGTVAVLPATAASTAASGPSKSDPGPGV